MSPEVWKITKFGDILLLLLCKTVLIEQGSEMNKRPHPSLLEKSANSESLRFKGRKLTTIAAKVYNRLLLNRIRPEVKKVLRQNQNGFWRN